MNKTHQKNKKKQALIRPSNSLKLLIINYLQELNSPMISTGKIRIIYLSLLKRCMIFQFPKKTGIKKEPFTGSLYKNTALFKLRLCIS